MWLREGNVFSSVCSSVSHSGEGFHVTITQEASDLIVQALLYLGSRFCHVPPKDERAVRILLECLVIMKIFLLRRTSRSGGGGPGAWATALTPSFEVPKLSIFTLRKVQKILPYALKSENTFLLIVYGGCFHSLILRRVPLKSMLYPWHPFVPL